MALVARGQPLEARHFGYGVLQHVVSRRWGSFSADERRQLAKLVYDKLSECGSAPADAPEPWMIKSKVATLMAQVVRQEGASMWTGLMPELAAGAGAGSPVLAELAALVMRYVAEDVAVYNSDIIGGKMKELLFGLTSTLPQALPALYRILEVRRKKKRRLEPNEARDAKDARLARPSRPPAPGLPGSSRALASPMTIHLQGSTIRTSPCGLLFNSLTEALERATSDERNFFFLGVVSPLFRLFRLFPPRLTPSLRLASFAGTLRVRDERGAGW